MKRDPNSYPDQRRRDERLLGGYLLAILGMLLVPALAIGAVWVILAAVHLICTPYC